MAAHLSLSCARPQTVLNSRIADLLTSPARSRLFAVRRTDARILLSVFDLRGFFSGIPLLAVGRVSEPFCGRWRRLARNVTIECEKLPLSFRRENDPIGRH